MNIRQLDKYFEGSAEVTGFGFKQIESNDKYHIYQVDDGFENIWYEVFETKIVPICIDFDNRIYSDSEFKVVYPKSKDFGIWAYTCTSLSSAIEKSHTMKTKIKDHEST